MTTYKEPFGKAWIKLLKTELFPNLLNNVQPIKICIHVGYGWDWISRSGLREDEINIEISEVEIAQCNFDEKNFICYVNFGKGYKFLNIPFKSIKHICIGTWENYILNPIPTTSFDLDTNARRYLLDLNSNEEELNDSVEPVNEEHI